MKTYDIIIIGAGAAGLLAAVKAGEKKESKILILEKMSKSAKKLRITGKGRCNITNTDNLKEFLTHIYPQPKFMYNSFSQFFSQDIIDFLESNNLKVKTERGGRIFPESDKASDVVSVLINSCKKNNVEIINNANVIKIKKSDNGFVLGAICNDMDKEFYAEKVIVATGGTSYPLTGSTGDGYRLAIQTGHTVTDIFPALIPLETITDKASKMQGISLKNVSTTVFVNGKKNDSLFGEMLFTHYGVSGPIILSLSRKCVQALREKKQVELSIDLKPALDHKTLDARLIREFEQNSKTKLKTLMKKLVPNRMIPVLIEETSLNGEKLCHKVTSDERKKLKNILKDFRFTVKNHRPIDEAIITAGGVNLKEINPKTMESKVCPGLYFTGEVINLDADTGGYNLQIAFSTGWVAGKHAAESLNSE